jgi:Tfp pilus assembly PilM family ATPase
MSQFETPISRDWANSSVLRDRGDILQTKKVPREGQQMQVLRVFLQSAIQNLNKQIQGYAAELIFNLDEVGMSDWEVAKREKLSDPRRFADR